MPRATIFSVARWSMRWPSKRISPREIGASPEIALSVVLLPAPLAPMMVTTPPTGTCIDTFFSAATLP
jgi:hypothetical protein